MRLLPLIATAALLTAGLAAHADTFNYNLNGGASGFSGTGTLTATEIGAGDYLVTGISVTGGTGLIAHFLYDW